jgi:succinate dehydrogenase flavin-adding protein (antitoxin of CptAB toxin-antitoxin module)
LEVVLRDYLTMYCDEMTYADLEQFDDEVLNIENPQLQRYFMNQEPLQPEHNTRYVNALVEYVNLRKVNYAKYVPTYA